MFRQLRALLRMEGPNSALIHYHLDDDGHRVVCDESRCRPKPATHPLYLLPR